MQDNPTVQATAPTLWLLPWVAVAFVILRAIWLGLTPDAAFAAAENDDVMRLLSVRAWLAGQGWFDMTQTAILPPEGVSLHWSRYVDLGIAAIWVPLSWALPMPQAEYWAAVLWPTLLLAGWIMVVWHGTRRLFGVAAAAIAVGAVLLWTSISVGYFGIGRVDHHNVQILALTIAAFAAVTPGHTARRGAVAGAAIAFSLAVGLETLFFVVAIGAHLLVMACWSPLTHRARLLGFCAALLFFAFIFFLGQTAPDRYLALTCDRLALPHLSLIATGVAAALAGIAFAPAISVRALRLLPPIIITLIGLWLLQPVLSPCLTPPYAHLPQAVQDLIGNDITEALPALSFAARYPASVADILALPVGAICVAVIARTLGGPRDGVMALLVLSGVGVVAVLLQIRQVVLLAAVAPALAGYGLVTLYMLHRAGRSAASFALIAGVALMLVLPAVDDRLVPSRSVVAADQGCTIPASLRALTALPPGRVLSPMNLGPKLALLTDHDPLAAPYHRSAPALINGFVPFRGSPDDMRDAVRDQVADYVIVCRNARYGSVDSAGSRLAAGDELPGLRLQPLTGTGIYAYVVEDAG